jgi:hypothetical protein
MRSTSDYLFLEGCDATFKRDGSDDVRAPLREVALLDIERFDPIRKPRPHKGQKHMPGVYWCASGASHVRYESLLELSALLRLDFDPAVERVCAQPFWLHFPRRSGAGSHAPDFFAVLADGGSRLVDVSRLSETAKPKRARAFDLTGRACRALGWEYVVMTEPEPTLITNLRALAGFRREPRQFYEFAAALLERVKDGATIGELSTAVGPPRRVRPVLFHLLWRGDLLVDLRRPLRETTVVLPTGGAL